MNALWPDGFLSPDRLYGLLAVIGVALAYLVLGFRRSAYTVKFTNLPLLDTVAPKRPGWRRHAAAAVFLAGIASMVVAWAQPSDAVLVPKERATVVLAIDTSLSMEAADITPSRIEAAKTAALSFIEGLPEQINVGLVTFDGVARVRVTPTTDRRPVRSAIETLELGPATAIGEAIFAGLDAIETAPIVDVEGEPVPATMVVMTDGKTTVGRPDADGAAAAVEAEIPISTIAFGTDRGTIVIDGEIQPVPVERVALREIADGTGGQFFEAESLGELESVYADIGSSIGYDTEEVEVTDRFVGYAVALLLLSTALSLLWFQRIP
ncbi:VWA domain-containing protein [Actinospongicola halichondriae]|uniref:VWA domain-containing protein n=1 Tax=Actinospongicola halichondriae TaxID=3236844 RepID=UPI003D380A06